MNSETDANLVARLRALWLETGTDDIDGDEMERLFALARRGAAAAARIEQLEAALREINQQRYTGRNTINLDNAYEMAIALNAKLLAVMDTARAALEEPHKTLGMRGPHVHSSEQILPLPAEASE